MADQAAPTSSVSCFFVRVLWSLSALVFVPALLTASASAQVIDLNADGRAELALFANGEFAVLDSTGLERRVACPGVAGLPVPGHYFSGGSGQLATWNPSFGLYQICSESGRLLQPWGEPGDIPIAADFSGDGLTDFTVYRRQTQEWFVLENAGGLGSAAVRSFQHPGGTLTSIPAAADFNGDGAADYALLSPEGDALRWSLVLSGGASASFLLGEIGDLPVPADYNGSGDAEPVVFRPRTAQWISAGGAVQFGLPGDQPAPLDFDGDGAVDLAVYRPTLHRWFLRLSSNPAAIVESAFGPAGGRVASGPTASVIGRTAVHDFNGDRLSDFAVVRRTTAGALAFLFDSAGSTIPAHARVELGSSSDLPLAGDFDGDGVTDPVSVGSASGELDWQILESGSQRNGRVELRARYGRAGDRLAAADYDGDGRTDLCIVRDLAGFLLWVPSPSGKQPLAPVSWGLRSDVTLTGDIDGDARSDFIVARRVLGELHWFTRSSRGAEVYSRVFGFAADTPIVSDVDGDGQSEIGVIRDVSGAKLMFFENGVVRSFGLSGDTVSLLSFSGSKALNNIAWRVINGQGFFFVLRPALGPILRPFGVTGDTPFLPFGFSAGSSASGGGKRLSCSSRSPIGAQESGFTWKPLSDGDGKLAVIFGSSLRAKIKTAALVLPGPDEDRVIETLRFVGNKGGTKPTFRGTKPGAGYQTGIVLVRQDPSGANHCIDVPNPAHPVP